MDQSSYLAKLNIKSLNDMQQKTAETIRENDQLILLSATGSGKTLAFLLPLLESLDPGEKLCQAMILVPSRELALQIDSVLKQMQTGFTGPGAGQTVAPASNPMQRAKKN